jgi:hypothetical protein
VAVRVELCIDVDINDIALLLMIARQENTPLDSLIKTAIAHYVAAKLTSPSTRAEKSATAGGEK